MDGFSTKSEMTKNAHVSIIMITDRMFVSYMLGTLKGDIHEKESKQSEKTQQQHTFWCNKLKIRTENFEWPLAQLASCNWTQFP